MKTIKNKTWYHFLEHAAAELVKQAKANKCIVEYNFNGILLRATPNTSPKTLECNYRIRYNQRNSAYRRSPKYLAYLQGRGADAVINQCLIDDLLANKDFSSVFSTVTWLNKFAEPADDIDVKYDKQSLAANLESKGYKKSAHVFTVEEQKISDMLRMTNDQVFDLIKSKSDEAAEYLATMIGVKNGSIKNPQDKFKDPLILGEYIIGQAINCLKDGMGPHPRLIKKFSKEYFSLLS